MPPGTWSIPNAEAGNSSGEEVKKLPKFKTSNEVMTTLMGAFCCLILTPSRIAEYSSMNNGFSKTSHSALQELGGFHLRHNLQKNDQDTNSSFLSEKPSTEKNRTARDFLLQETVESIRHELSSSPSGLLLTGIDTHALREAVETAVRPVRFRSCCNYFAGEDVSSASSESIPLCLEDVDIPGSEVEGAVKGVFSERLSQKTILGIAQSERHIPSSLLRAGRFEKVLQARAPSFSAREAAWRQVTSSLHAKNMLFEIPKNAASELAAISPGYSANDFTHIMYAFLGRTNSWGAAGSQDPYCILRDVVGGHKPLAGSSDLDFITSSATSLGNELILSDNWDECGGYKEVKDMLVRFCEWPVRYRGTFERLGVEPPRGVLLYGPRGCGKTMLALSFLRRLKHANWLHVNAPDLFSKYLGDSEARVRALFDRARCLSPCVVFIDELDVVGGGRQSGGDDGGGSGVERRVLGTLLTELDGVSRSDVFVLSCTSSLDVIDPALIRPGRLDHLLQIEPPELNDRFQILQTQLRNIPLGALKRCTPDDKDNIDIQQVMIHEIAEDTKGFTGADLQALCREAVIIAMEEENEPEFISKSHFLEATKRVCHRTATLINKQLR